MERRCEICGAVVATFKGVCSGDGGNHWHGAVHTILRGSTNDLAMVGVECGCAERDHIAWNDKSKRPVPVR